MRDFLNIAMRIALCGIAFGLLLFGINALGDVSLDLPIAKGSVYPEKGGGAS